MVTSKSGKLCEVSRLKEPCGDSEMHPSVKWLNPCACSATCGNSINSNAGTTLDHTKLRKYRCSARIIFSRCSLGMRAELLAQSCVAGEVLHRCLDCCKFFGDLHVLCHEFPEPITRDRFNFCEFVSDLIQASPILREHCECIKVAIV